VISRLKIMSDINIAERRIPQDGRVGLVVGGKAIDLRVATLPTVYGEKVVMRILDKSSVLLKLSDLGFSAHNYERYKMSYTKPYGMILVTGPTGSGKSTTLASMIDWINQHRACHIITIEDPVEYVYDNAQAVVEQREVGRDATTFADALRSAFREDPDVLLIGEMRDYETIASAITIAETGHLVFATLHTNDSAQAIDRIVDVFPSDAQRQIRIQLANTLSGVIYQQLLPSKLGGRVAAFEVLLATSAVKNLIKEGKSNQIRNILQTSAREGMQTLERSLSQLVQDGKVSIEDAKARSIYPDEVREVF
jgi:twitching motility protein PilT